MVAEGPKLGESHQLWQMNEVNKLIWPAPGGIGVIDDDLWQQTIDVADGARTSSVRHPATTPTPPTLAQAAVDALEDDGVDVTGGDYEPVEVELRPGGE